MDSKSVCGDGPPTTKRMLAVCGFSTRTFLALNAINTKGANISM